MSDTDATDKEILERLERRRAAARDRYRSMRSSEVAAERRRQITQASISLKLNEDEREIIGKLIGSSAGLPPRQHAVAEHIIFCLLELGSPFRGWQDDARDALSVLPA